MVVPCSSFPRQEAPRAEIHFIIVYGKLRGRERGLKSAEGVANPDGRQAKDAMQDEIE
jgi:hypothetical protein